MSDIHPIPAYLDIFQVLVNNLPNSIFNERIAKWCAEFARIDCLKYMNSKGLFNSYTKKSWDDLVKWCNLPSKSFKKKFAKNIEKVIIYINSIRG